MYSCEWRAVQILDGDGQTVRNQRGRGRPRVNLNKGQEQEQEDDRPSWRIESNSFLICAMVRRMPTSWSSQTIVLPSPDAVSRTLTSSSERGRVWTLSITIPAGQPFGKLPNTGLRIAINDGMDASSHRQTRQGFNIPLNTAIAEGAASNSTTLHPARISTQPAFQQRVIFRPRKPTRSHLSASVRYGVANRTAAPRAAKPSSTSNRACAVTDRRSKSVHRAKERQARGERRRQKRDGACHLHPMSQPGFSPRCRRGVHKPNAALSNSAGGIWWIPARKSRLSATVNSPNRVKDWAR